jgi:hypothetical protein
MSNNLATSIMATKSSTATDIIAMAKGLDASDGALGPAAYAAIGDMPANKMNIFIEYLFMLYNFFGAVLIIQGYIA